MLSGIVIELQCTPNKNYKAQSNFRRCTHSEVLTQMFFLNKSVQLLLLLVLLSRGQGAPSHGDQLAAEEDEEIEDSEDNLKVFEADEQKTQEAIDSTPGVSEDDDARGSVDITEVAHSCAIFLFLCGW